MQIRLKVLILAAVSVLALSVAACSSAGGGSSANGQSPAANAGTSNANCPGTPIKIMAMGVFDPNGATYEPSHLVGPQAAAKAINATCQLGRPISIVACNDHATTQGSLTCGQTAVSEGVLAITGHPQSDAYIPIVSPHNIPAVMDLANGSQELSYKYAYPLASGPSLIVATAAIAADVGAKKVQLLTFGGSQVAFFDSIISAAASSLGLQKLPNIVAPLTANDMTAYAAQAISSGTDSVILGTTSEQVVAFVKALRAQGADNNKIKLIGGTSLTTSVIQQLGPNAEGIYSANEAADPGDPSNPGIQQMLNELRANGTEINGVNVNQFTVSSWTAVHLIADAMKGATDFTPEELGKRLNALPPDFSKGYPAVPPFDFSKNAIPDNPVLGKARIFSNQMAVYQVQNGKLAPVVDGYVRIDQKANLN